MNEFEEAKNLIDEMAKKLNKEIGASISAFTLATMLTVEANASNEGEANKLGDYMFEKIIKIFDDYKEITVEALNNK